MRVRHKYGSEKAGIGKLGVGISKDKQNADDNHQHTENR